MVQYGNAIIEINGKKVRAQLLEITPIKEEFGIKYQDIILRKLIQDNEIMVSALWSEEDLNKKESVSDHEIEKVIYPESKKPEQPEVKIAEVRPPQESKEVSAVRPPTAGKFLLLSVLQGFLSVARKI